MLEILQPRLFVDNIYGIDDEHLWGLGIRGIIFDLDNTILPWKSKSLPAETTRWMAKLKDRGFKLCIVSNGMPRRVHKIIRPLDIPTVPIAVKPTRRAFLLAMATMETTTRETAVVGDQVFTDILGGNRLSLFTILVKPISNREFMGTKVMRALEKFVLGLPKKSHKKEEG